VLGTRRLDGMFAERHGLSVATAILIRDFPSWRSRQRPSRDPCRPTPRGSTA
jgi:hypothetical protein